MESLSNIGAWISQNEALLSGIAAMIVVAGVIFTPVGAAVRRFLRNTTEADPSLDAPGGTPPREAPANERHEPTDRPSIAVLPLSSMSADADQQHLADGMTEDIITALAANRHLYVVSRNSTFAYKGQSPDIRDVGRELRVRYVLEGSLRSVGDVVRTTVQLIDAADGNHVWAEKYDQSSSEMSHAQDQVVSDIAGSLALQLVLAERRRAEGGATETLGTWELMHKAMAVAMSGSPTIASAAQARELARKAVERGPEDSGAQSLYAWLLFMSAINGFVKDPMQTMREGESHLEAALDNGAADPLAQTYLGCAYLYTGRYEQAIRFLERSLRSDPHQPDALLHLALATAYLGDFAKSHKIFDRADRSESGIASGPFLWYRAIAYCLEERYEEAILTVEPVLDVSPRYAFARITLAVAHEGMGETRKAQAEVVRAAELDPGLCVDGLALNIKAHPNRATGQARVEMLRRYWPSE